VKPDLDSAAMKRVRFAPSPTGSLHIGNALSAVANRALGDWMLLRIDDTDAARNVPGGEEAILRDLAWLGVEWDEGPVLESERAERHRERPPGCRSASPERCCGLMTARLPTSWRPSSTMPISGSRTRCAATTTGRTRRCTAGSTMRSALMRPLRVALTGRDRGPELAAVLTALDRDETLRRLDAAV
jgi:glutamyl/glutaminyl-tRNA synthetase